MRNIMRGVLSFFLLTIYTIAMYMMLSQVYEWGHAGDPGPHDFPANLVWIVTTIGTLVSALVITTLSIAERSGQPDIPLVKANNNGEKPGWVKKLANLYIAVWFLVGFSASILGLLLFPDINQTLSDIGKSFIGLAIAAAYALFGVEPKELSKTN